MKRPPFSLIQIITHVGAWLPLIILLWDASQNRLGVNPIQDMTLRTGKTALVLLILSLTATPAAMLGFRKALKIRRALGLYAFGYALIHLFIYVGLDYGFDLHLLWLELTEKRYVIAGFTAWLLMVPLVLTSTRGWQRRLGRRWKTLHRLAYISGIAATVHFVWLVKSDIRTPLAFAGILLLLLLARLPTIRKRLTPRHRLGAQLSKSRQKEGKSETEPGVYLTNGQIVP